MKNIPGRTSMAQQQIIFKANLPALGFNTYYFEKKSMFYPRVLKRTFSFPYLASMKSEIQNQPYKLRKMKHVFYKIK